MKGRKPTPTALKKLAGNPGKRRLPTDEPEMPVESPDPPEWLNGEALAEWNRIVPQLHEAGIMALSYRSAIASYCEAWARFVDAIEQIPKTGGEIVKSPSGFPIQNPYAAVRNKAQAQMLKVAAEFGMTASSKTRIKAIGDNPAAKATPLKLFASGRA